MTTQTAPKPQAPQPKPQAAVPATAAAPSAPQSTAAPLATPAVTPVVQQPLTQTPTDPITVQLLRTAQALGVDVSILESAGLRAKFAEAIHLGETQFADVRDAIVKAVGTYRSFSTITVMVENHAVVVRRNVAARHGGGGGGKGGNPNAGQSFAGIPRVIPQALADKYHLSTTEYKSARALAHVVAAALHAEPPADNRVPAWLKLRCEDIWTAIGSPTA